MSIPKPQPPKQPAPAKGKDVKQPFVLRPHLTEKPFRNHEGLAELRKSLGNTPRDRRTKH